MFKQGSIPRQDDRWDVPGRRFLSPERRLQLEYERLGGAQALGEIRKEEKNIWYCEAGALYYDADLVEVFSVTGAIFEKWMSLGGVNWGLPCSNELPTARNDARFNRFNGGAAAIYFTPTTGAHAIWGAILQKWGQLNWEFGPLGFPVSDETATPDGIGRFNHFQHGSIYWTPATGAHGVWGAIGAHWAALGWEQSALGYPTSDETDCADGGRANTFEHGGIYWWGDTGAIALRDIAVQYTGLYCFGESDWDKEKGDSDEPYAILSVTTPERAVTLRTQVYGDVDRHEARRETIELYRGKPYGLNLGMVLMEEDEGDPNAYRAEVEKAVNAAHALGVKALGLIPGLGPAIAAVAGPVLGSLMPKLAEVINDLLNTGDDRIGAVNLTLGAKQLVLLAARTPHSNFKGIDFKVESPLISGDGASYKLYFTVLPA